MNGVGSLYDTHACLMGVEWKAKSTAEFDWREKRIYGVNYDPLTEFVVD